MNELIGIGIMSGTSLDGLDLAAVRLYEKTKQTHFEIIATHCIPIDNDIVKNLENAKSLSGLELALLDRHFGNYIGQNVKKFITDFDLHADFIASHGQTIFHQPNKGLTFQIGSGANIHAACGVPVVCDFRSLDLAYGGQGAPLVPIGDQHLFSSYDACVNLGGFANISYQNQKNRIAYDIGPCNLLLNHLSQSRFNRPYDKDGILGKSGELNTPLFETLNKIPFYHQNPPKSLGTEWLENDLWSVFQSVKLSKTDQLTTAYHHVAFQIAKEIPSANTLITGGGAHNDFLFELIKHYSQYQILQADSQLIDFKEAILFAYLGYLRILGKNNCLSSVTGAQTDNCGGAIYGVHK